MIDRSPSPAASNPVAKTEVGKTDVAKIHSLAGAAFAAGISGLVYLARSRRRADPRRHRDPRATGDGAAWRIFAADRILRISGGIAGFCAVRQQPLPFQRRRLDHHADFRRQSCVAGHVRLARLCRARRRAGADGRPRAGGRRHLPARLDRRPALDPGDRRISGRHLDPHSDLATAGHSRAADASRRRCCSGLRRWPEQLPHANLFTLASALACWPW